MGNLIQKVKEAKNLSNNTRGGRRTGAGRKAKGITKKVSLTLTEQLWDEVNQFDGTVADYIRSLKNTLDEKSNFIQSERDIKDMNRVTQFNEHQEESHELTKEHIQYCWEIYKQDFLLEQDEETKVTDIAIENAHKSLIRGLFNGNKMKIETSQRYRSPFTNNWFSSIENMLRKEIPKLISWSQTELTRKAENAKRQEENAKYNNYFK